MSEPLTPIELAPGTDQLVTHAKGGLKISYNRERTRVRVTAPGVYVPPEPPPPTTEPPPPIGTIVLPGDDIKALLAKGLRRFLLRTGTHKLSFGTTPPPYKDVTIIAYPGDVPFVEPIGTDHNFVYLGPSSGTWTLGVAFRGFAPVGNGFIGIGDGCRLETVPGFKYIGPGGVASNKNQAVYFYGTGTGRLDHPDVTDAQGSALQTYLPSGANKPDYPQVEVIGGRLHGKYVGVFGYSGHIKFTGTDIKCTGGGPNDADIQEPGTAEFIGCTGGGTSGQVRVWNHK